MVRLMYKIANERPVHLMNLNPALPGCFAAIIRRAAAKQPERRYKTGEEMARAVRECAAVYGAVDVSL
jgi:hypothetical protein